MSYVKPKKALRIWTAAYSPFIMGGDVHAPIATDIEDYIEVDLGRGYKGYFVVSPNGTICIVEAITGGIIGHELNEVRKDVREADEKVVAKQLCEMAEKGKKAIVLTPERFWARYERQRA